MFVIFFVGVIIPVLGFYGLFFYALCKDCRSRHVVPIFGVKRSRASRVVVEEPEFLVTPQDDHLRRAA
jgi:hypothetical protein